MTALLDRPDVDVFEVVRIADVPGGGVDDQMPHGFDELAVRPVRFNGHGHGLFSHAAEHDVPARDVKRFAA